MERRIQALENSSLRVDAPEPQLDQPPSNDEVIAALLASSDPSSRNPPFNPLTQPRVGASHVDSNTVFGQAEVGGSAFDLTMNSLFTMVQRLETQHAVFMDRSKSQGVLFHELAFVLELEFVQFFLMANPTGKGVAAFVDLILVWTFASMEQVATNNWLQTFHKSLSTGFTNTLEN